MSRFMKSLENKRFQGFSNQCAIQISYAGDVYLGNGIQFLSIQFG